MAMRFWGAEVKAKEPLNVSLEQGSVIHVSQATLGDIKKDNETVIIHVATGGKKLVLGMLSQKTPQLSFDLVFDEDFEISHNQKSGSIHLMGYQSEMPIDVSDFDSTDEEDEDIPIAKENGQIAALAGVKPQVNNAPKPEEDDSDEDDSDDDDESDSDGSDSDEVMAMGDSDSDDDIDESEDSEEKPTNVNSGKKRPNVDAKTPPQAKKANIATPQKTDGKKGAVHPATPHPNKKGGDKTPKTGGGKTPVSGGSGSDASRGPGKKNNKNNSAVKTHQKPKHGGKK